MNLKGKNKRESPLNSNINIKAEEIEKGRSEYRSSSVLDEFLGEPLRLRLFGGAFECIERARDYETAAQLRVSTGEVKKAVSDYEKAYKLYRAGREKGLKNYGTKSEERCRKYAERLEKVRRGKWGRLESKTVTATASVIALIGGLFFLSSNLTGNIIGNMTNSTSNWIGGILFAVGIIGSFVYFKKK